MALDQVLDALGLEVLSLILLQVQDDLGAASDLLALSVLGDGERAAGLRGPDVL